MTASRGQGTSGCRAGAVTAASWIGQSTGALLIRPVRPAGCGHHAGARAGRAGPMAHGGNHRPKRNDTGRRKPGQ